jgi:hypothetical protein
MQGCPTLLNLTTNRSFFWNTYIYNYTFCSKQAKSLLKKTEEILDFSDRSIDFCTLLSLLNFKDSGTHRVIHTHLGIDIQFWKLQKYEQNRKIFLFLIKLNISQAYLETETNNFLKIMCNNCL